MSRKDDIKDYEGIAFGVLNASPWKHLILKFVARLLYSRKAKYVLVIHDLEPKD